MTDCPVESYADDVLHGTLVAGPHVRAECRRHLNDLKPETQRERGFYWNREASDKILSFFPNVLSLLGDFEGRPFELKRNQQFILGRTFGFERMGGRVRRFRHAYVETSRGSGKTPMAAGIALYMMLFDNVPRAEIYICAATRDQALITFKDALGMVEQSEYLSEMLPPPLGGERLEKMVCPANGAIFKSLAFHPTGRGAIGLRPHGAIIDELHEHSTPGMLNAMTSGFKANKRALCIMLTNSGVDKDSVCYQERMLAIEAAKGDDPRLDNRMAYVCAVDKGDDPLDERTWIKTNPVLNPDGLTDPAKDTGIPGYGYLRERKNTAEKSPAKMSDFLRFNCCEWTESYGSWLGRGLFRDACDLGKELRIEDYKGLACWCGADLALRRCMTAIVLVFLSKHPECKYDVFPMFWMADDVIKDAEKRDHREGLYTLWKEKGYLNAPVGNTIDYQHVARFMASIGRDYEVRGMAYDRRYVETLTMEFAKMADPPSFPMVPHPQAFLAPLPSDPDNKEGTAKLYMPTSIKQTEILLRQKRVRVAPNPILASHVAASVAVPNRLSHKDTSAETSDEIKLGSSSPGEYIDGAVALVQAIGYAEALGEDGGKPSFDFW